MREATFTISLVDFEYFLLVLVRIATFMFVAPFFSTRNVPARVRIGISFFAAVIIFQALHPEEAYSYVSVVGYAVLVLKEAITGLLIGFAANICSYIVIFAGDIIDMDIGLSMATEFDPSTGGLVTMTGQLYYYFISMMIIVSGMYQYIFNAIMDSFKLIKLGGANFQAAGMVKLMTVYMADFFIIAFRIVLPVFACTMTLNVVLGVIAKVAPQMNMFSIGIQLKMLLGFTILFLIVFIFPQVADMIFDEMRNMIVSMVRLLE
jgi:flagellar biosynthetic protein FliR